MFMALIAKFPALLYLADAATPCTITTSANHQFLGLPYWWEYLQGQPDGVGGCGPVFHGAADILPVALAIADILLHIAGFVAVIGVIIGGISYIVAIGNPEKITSSRKTIQNALIGLAIALVADQIVAFIGKSLT